MPLSIRDCDVIRVLMQGDLRRGMSIMEVSKQLNKPQGALAPRFARLERFGYIEGRWHGDDWQTGGASIDPPEPGRPRRRYYRPTPKGRRGRAETMLSQSRVRQVHLAPETG